MKVITLQSQVSVKMTGTFNLKPYPSSLTVIALFGHVTSQLLQQFSSKYFVIGLPRACKAVIL